MTISLVWLPTELSQSLMERRMHDLIISWPSGTKTFSSGDSPVSLGRSLESSVVVVELTASRHHLEITWTGDAWVAEDVSTHGSYASSGDALEKQWTVAEDTTIRLGDPDGQDIEIKLVTASEASRQPPLPPEAQEHRMTSPLDEASPAIDGDQSNVRIGGFSSIDQKTPEDPGDDLLAVSSGVPPMPGAINEAEAVPDANREEATAGQLADDGNPQTPEAPQPPTFDAPLTPETPAPETPQPGSIDSSTGVADATVQITNPITIEPPNRTEVMADETSSDEPDLPTAIAGTPQEQAAPLSPTASAAVADQAKPQVQPPASADSALQTSAAQTPPMPTSQPFSTDPPASAPPPAGAGKGLPVTSPFDAAQKPPQPAVSQPAAGGGHWASQPSETVIQDHSLRIEVDNEHHVFHPNQEVTIGRDQECSIVLDKRHSLASRRHVRAAFRDGSWWLEDFSSKGTFVDGTQIKNPYEATGGFIAFLGNKQAGTELKIVAPGEHKSNTARRWPLFAGIAAAAILLIGVVAVGIVATRGEEEVAPTTISEAEMEAAFLDLAKRSTVLIIEGDSRDVSSGSGFFVSETLVVTNQHVVAGDDLVEVAVSKGNDDPVELTYVAEIVELHPFLDIAVLELTGELVPAPEFEDDPDVAFPGYAIEPLESGSESFVEVGESEGLVLGTTVFSTGFPGSFNSISTNNEGNVLLPPVGTDSGNAASLAIWPGCDNPTGDLEIPRGSPPGVKCNDDGDVKNAVVTTSLTSGPGASGSPVYQDEKVIAVVYAGAAGADETNTGRSITSSSFKAWLDPIIAAN